MTGGLFKIAAAGLFVALGAADDEIQEAFEILERHEVPATIAGTAQVARDALELVRIQRADRAD